MRKFPLYKSGKIRMMRIMEETLRLTLIDLAAKFEAATGVSPATAAKRALNDNTFFSRIEEGAGFNIRTFDRLVEWFAGNWPADADWPSDVSRPASETEAA
jgi:hypothetical protein